jgi:glycolate oxidase iron-sulfur subunit
MALGVQKYGRNQKIVHTVQLLDWAYQKEEGDLNDVSPKN